MYEFWRLVRASRGEEDNAYSPLLAQADAWATVDIVSGASAGGINGVLLGKALATGADLASVRSLWVEGADFAGLLRNPREKDPASILRTDRFDELLERGLEQMDRGGTHRELVDVFDLFVPGTRLRPRRRDAIDELGQILKLREYRKIFHLKFRKRGYNEADPSLGYDRNDFRPPMNGVLAQVARATSAFPVAFEPKLIVRDEANRMLFEDGDPHSAWFSDGGILHNKPFTEALATIFARAAERPVRRWLLAVEPDPEHFVPPPGPEVYPEAPEVVSKALMGIPRYQSIATDLDDLEAHRQRVARAQRLLETVDGIASAVAPDVLEDDARFASFLDGQLLFAAYRRLRRESFAAAFRDRLLESVAFERPGQRRWISEGAQQFVSGLTEAELDELDHGFELRRVYYLLDSLKKVRNALGSDARDLLAPFQRRLWAEFDRVSQIVWAEFDNPGNPRAAALRRLAARVDADLRDGVVEALNAATPALQTGLDTVRDRVEDVCTELDAALGGRGSPPLPAAFRTIFRRYTLWDTFILPIDHLAGAAERDRVGFIRISPEAATYVKKDAAQKVAGDSLGHFGGFARRAWRDNDILWGRLDAAEVIVRVLLEGRDRQELEPAFRAVQEEVVGDELPDVTGDYRSFLEKSYAVGSETVADIPMDARARFLLNAATVLRNMMRRLSTAPLSRGLPRMFRWTGNLLSFALLLTRWPVLAIWGRDEALRSLLTLLVLFVAGWAVLSTVLVVFFDVAEVDERFWILVVSAVFIFLVWAVLMTMASGIAARVRRLLHRGRT